MKTNRFASLISALPGVGTLMPLTHVTDGFGFCEIMPQKMLALPADKDDAFNEHLLFFFYGRAAYRSSHSHPTKLNAFSMTCFVLRSETLPVPKGIHPFDTGAMHRGFYKAYMHRRMTLDDFTVPGPISESRKIVQAFFDTNLNYFLGDPQKNKTFPPTQLEAQCYHSLICSDHLTDADDRKGSVEVQFDKPIELIKGSVLAVVLPEIFWDDDDVWKFVADLGAEPFAYDCFHANPIEDTRSIMEAIKPFLVAKGYLS